jgi:hypothetical protein
MNVEQLMEWELAGETELLREKEPQCHFVYHKSHMTWPEMKSGCRCGTPHCTMTGKFKEEYYVIITLTQISLATNFNRSTTTACTWKLWAKQLSTKAPKINCQSLLSNIQISQVFLLKIPHYTMQDKEYGVIYLIFRLNYVQEICIK